MTFTLLLDKINVALASLPLKNHQRSSLRLNLSRMLNQYIDKPTPGNPIELSNDDIDTLVDLAVANKLIIERHGKKTDLLTILISMGCWQQPTIVSDDGRATFNADPYLGCKDLRIENEIVKRAKAEIARRNQNPLLCTKNSAVFGASMNPPTNHHLAFIKHLIENGYFVHIIPNAASPLKSVSDYAPAAHRYQMTQLALEERQDLSKQQYKLETLEIDRGPPSRMLMTLSALILLSEPSEIFTLILTLDDNFEKFTSWYKWEALGALCPIRFYTRPGLTAAIAPETMIKTFNALLDNDMVIFMSCATQDEMAQMQRMVGFKAKRMHWRVDPLPTQVGAATTIRQHFKTKKQSVPFGLSEAVYKYILDNRLYQ